jgi:hypothetical protein
MMFFNKRNASIERSTKKQSGRELRFGVTQLVIFQKYTLEQQAER